MSSSSILPAGNQQHIDVGPAGVNYARGESSTGGLESPCCIFKIPSFLTRIKENSDGYQPTVVSIGPYHHGIRKLKWIQTLKPEFMTSFIRKAGDDVNEKALVDAVTLKLSDIKESYSDSTGVGEGALIKMMVLDGCFLLMLFLTNARRFPKERSLFTMPWVLPSIRRDLLLLGNQIPLHVLQVLQDTANFAGQTINLKTIALNFFSNSFKHRQGSWENINSDLEAKHLLHLIHNTFILTRPQANDAHIIPIQANDALTPEANNALTPEANAAPVPPPHIRSVRLTLPANRLRSRGMKFKLRKNVNTFLNISFKKGVLLIPEIILDDFLTVVLLNCIAFEHFYANASTDITSYAMFMGCLVNSTRDVAYLVEKGIIQNCLGTEAEVSRFFKRILNDYVFDIDRSYLRVTIEDVEEYSSNECNLCCATFKQAYVGSPWIFISKLAAFALLLLTIAQVVLATIALKGNPRPQVIVVMGNNG